MSPVPEPGGVATAAVVTAPVGAPRPRTGEHTDLAGPARRSTDRPRTPVQDQVNQALKTLLTPTGSVGSRLAVSGRLVARFGDNGVHPPTHISRHGTLLLENWGTTDLDQLDALALLLARTVDQSLIHDDLVAALVETQNQVLSLYAVSQIQGSSTGRADVEDRLVQAVARLTRSEAVTLMAGGEDTRWGDARPAEWLHEAITRQSWSPAGRAVHFSGDEYTGMIWPLAGKHGEPAALALARTEVFRTTDFKLMGFLGGIIASARDTAFLHEEAVSRAGIEHEHRIASRLAQAVLPAKAPVIPNCEVSERTIPALSAGGDFYTHSVIGGDLYFAVGDVAGKGLPAALVMTKVIAACASSFSRHAPERVSDVVADLCDELYPYLSEIGLFATILVGSYCPDTGALHLFNAGHSPTMVVRADGVQQIPPTMPPLGVLAAPIGSTQTIMLEPGDLLVAGSDGLTEQENPDGEMFGYDRFTEEVAGMHARSANELTEYLLHLVAQHAAGVHASDDQTLFVIRHGEADPSSRFADPSPDARLTIAATHLAARDLGPWLAELCSGVAQAPAVLPRLELALHELCINIVDHAYHGVDGEIFIAASLLGTEIRLEVRDRGEQFVEAAVVPPQPDVPQVRGYGLLLIEQLVDSTFYERQANENVWTMTIRLEPVT